MSKLTDRAEQLEKEGNLEGALNYFEMGLGEKSAPYYIRNDFGRILNKLGNYNESQSCFDLVLTMDEDNIESWFGKGISSLGLNNWEQALFSFEKVIELDNANANAYYYKSIILKEFESDDAYKYYEKFLQLDNDEFKEIRKCYKFGLIFNQRDLELQNSNKNINIEGFKHVLSSYNLSEEDITFYLRTYSFDRLQEKITSLNDIKYEDDEKRIIMDEFVKLGLDESDVEDLFVLESIETLKDKVISKTGNNPFYEKKNPLNITFYIENENNEIYPSLNDMPVLIASNYNKFERLDIANNISIFSKFSKKLSRKIRTKDEKIYSVFNKRLNKIQKDIDEGDYEKAFKDCDVYLDLSVIPDLSLKIDYIFYKISLSAKVKNNFKELISDFDELENLCSDLKQNPIYLFNKANLLYDLGKFYSAVNCYNDSLITGNNNDVAIFLKTSAFFKLSNFKEALQTYECISDENKDENILNYIKNHIN